MAANGIEHGLRAVGRPSDASTVLCKLSLSAAIAPQDHCHGALRPKGAAAGLQSAGDRDHTKWLTITGARGPEPRQGGSRPIRVAIPGADYEARDPCAVCSRNRMIEKRCNQGNSHIWRAVHNEQQHTHAPDCREHATVLAGVKTKPYGRPLRGRS